MKSRSFAERVTRFAAVAALAAIAGEVLAFAGVVVPARFELRARPGQVVANVLEIGNDAVTPDEFSVRTADWELSKQGGVVLHDESLQPGSCRPWVRIERRTVQLPPRSTRRFRFEVHVPPDTPPVECRFALVVQSTSEKLPEIRSGNIVMPVQGRLGVIVYVAVGDVAPKLEVRSVELGEQNGMLVPLATVHNSGTAHGRIEGVLQGTDAAGRRVEFSVSTFPILAGETRAIPIWPADEPGPGSTPPAWSPPLRLRGDIEWPGGKHRVDRTLEKR
jgi:hypothetical protein